MLQDNLCSLRVRYLVELRASVNNWTPVSGEPVYDNLGIALLGRLLDRLIVHHGGIATTLTSSTTMSSSNFQFFLDALADYANQTGIDLTKYPQANKFQSYDSPESVLVLLQDTLREFKVYREGNRSLSNWLSPVVQAIHAFSPILSEIAGLVSPTIRTCLVTALLFRLQVPFHPTKAIFIGIDVLLCVRICLTFSSYILVMCGLFQAAIGVSTSYDALIDLFECVANFLKRLNIYTEKIAFTTVMTDIIVKILVEVLTVLALATKQIKQGKFSKYPVVIHTFYGSAFHREVRKEALGRKGDRGRATKAGSTYSRRGPDDGCPYSGSGLRSFRQYEGRNGWYVALLSPAINN
jgi:hypothetical protein